MRVNLERLDQWQQAGNKRPVAVEPRNLSERIPVPQDNGLAQLERELEQLRQQLPRHSISPAIQARMDELEEEIAALKQEIDRTLDSSA